MKDIYYDVKNQKKVKQLSQADLKYAYIYDVVNKFQSVLLSVQELQVYLCMAVL